MLQRSRFAMVAVAFTTVIGGAVLAVTSMAATPSAPTPTTAAAAAPALSAQERASAAALAKVPGGTIKGTETECMDGRLVYSFEIATSTGVSKIVVDALTGVASVEADDDDDEKGEGVEAAKEGHAEDPDDDEDEDDDKGGCSDSQKTTTARK